MDKKPDHYSYTFSVTLKGSKAVVSTDDTGAKNSPVSPKGLTVVGTGKNTFDATTTAPNWLLAFQDVKSFFEGKRNEVSHAGSLTKVESPALLPQSSSLIEQQIRARAAIKEILSGTFYDSDNKMIEVPISLLRFLGDFLDIIREESYSKDESQW